METLRDLDLVRAAAQVGELRADDDTSGDGEAGMPTMVVRFSKFNAWYEIDSFFEGRFLERTAKGAFKRTINNRREQIKVLYDHGLDFQIGNKILGPIDDLREDTDSPVGEVPLLDTSYNRDLLPGLEAGVYGSSFRFRVVKDEWNDDPGRSAHNPDGIPERTIKEVKLFEFGPVTFPANPDSTAGVRSLTDLYYERLRMQNPQQYDEILSKARALRTSQAGPAASTSASEPASSTADDSAAGHSRGMTHAERRAVLYPFLAKEGSHVS